MSDEYAVLVAPSSNRVYAADAPRLAAAELRWLVHAVTGSQVEAQTRAIADVEYVVIRTDAPWDDLAPVLGASAAAWAVFGIADDLLRPLRLPRRSQFSDDLVTIPKYTGKTNEQLTHLLLGLTIAATDRPQRVASGSVLVLDPVCGRGTTLSTATMLGYSSIGVDIDRKSIELYSAFLKTWAKTHRLPHTHDYGRLRRAKRTLGDRLEFTVAPDRAAQKAGSGTSVTAYAADTMLLPELVRAGSVDVVVGDLPYGVQHGAHRGHDFERRPGDLVAQAAPLWKAALRSGGAIGLSYNAKTLPPEDLAGLLDDAGFESVDGCDEFGHRVDASIQRELLVARVPTTQK